MGDCQARICEGLGVKFPGPTRRGHEYVGFGANRGPRFHWFADSVPSRDCFFANWFLISKLSFAKTPHEAILIRVTCYTASLYVIDFTCALNFGEAQECRDKNEHRLELCRKTNSHALKHFEIFERHTWELGAPGFVPAPSRSADGLEKIRHLAARSTCARCASKASWHRCACARICWNSGFERSGARPGIRSSASTAQ